MGENIDAEIKVFIKVIVPLLYQAHFFVKYLFADESFSKNFLST